MKKIAFIQAVLAAVFICFLVSPLAARGASDAIRPAVLSVEDSLGRKVELKGVPERIIMAGKAVIMLADALYLFPGTAERVVAVGVTDQGLGDFFPVLDPRGGEKQVLGKDPGAEEIAFYNPDLILLKTSMKSTLGAACEALGFPVIYLSLETPEEYTRDIRILGNILNQQERGEEILSLYESRLGLVKEAAASGPEPRVLILNFSERGGNYSFSVSPESWIQSTQVLLAGGRPVWFESAVSPGWNQVQFEQIAAWNPDRIIIISYQTPSARVLDRLNGDPLWKQLSAVQKGHVYAFPSDYYSWGQPDTRWILGVQWLSRVFYSGAPGSGNFPDEISLFFHEFYGMDRNNFDQKIKPLLQGSLIQ